MSPAKRRAMVVVMALVMGVWTAISAMSLADWRPPLLALGGVGVLLFGAAILARLHRSSEQQRSGGLVAWLDGCPRWFEGVVLGLTLVALGTGLYRFFGRLDGGTGLGRSDWAFDPLMVFVLGGLAVLHLLQMRRLGSREDER